MEATDKTYNQHNLLSKKIIRQFHSYYN